MTLNSAVNIPRMRRPKSLANELLDAITQNIRDGGLKVGEKLPTESEMMETFSVSRTVVREAISKLQANGLVETRHGVGTFVTAVEESAPFVISPSDISTVQDIVSVLELRLSLESEAAGLAAQRRTQENIDKLEEIINVFRSCMKTGGDTLASDFQFHMEVARATGNPHFVNLMNYLGTMIIPRSRVNTPGIAPEGKLQYLQRTCTEHENIMEAIIQGDSDAAKAAMRTHLSNSRERLRRGQSLLSASSAPASE